jgi:glyoxylase-like metal-dependent hydrolase (beta-lactamase superfamily II)
MTRAAVEVAEGVLVMTSRRYATNTTVVVAGGEAIVIDPSWDPDELADVADLLRAVGATCVAGIATHLHYDHVMWHPSLPAVPRWATPWTVDSWHADRERLLKPLIGDLPDELLELVGRVDAVPGAPRASRDVPGNPYPPATRLPAGYRLPWSGREIVLHEHDAHARGHLALEIPDSRVVICGDMLSDVEIPYPDEDDPDLHPYLIGFDRLADVVRRCGTLVPGHGTPTDDPMSRVTADRLYLDGILGRPGDDELRAHDGDWSKDPRLADPEMRELHERNVAQAQASERNGPRAT